MNENFIQEFYSGACFMFRKESEDGYQNNVCFSMVDETGHYIICLKEEDRDQALFYTCFHRVLMEEFSMPVADENEVLGDCFSLKELQNNVETMKKLNPTEVALMENDEIPNCVRRIAVIAEYEDAAVTEDFLPIGRTCAEVVFEWKKTIADRYFGGLLMAEASLISVFFKLAKDYAN